MCNVSNIIVPRQILYKESIYLVIVYVLASAPCWLFPAAIVVDLFDEFILEFIWFAI